MKLNEPDIEMRELERLLVSEDSIRTFEVTDDQGQQRPLGLMDADHTLADTDADGQVVINRKLLSALKAKGIKDLYLFTDMMLLPYQIKDRLYLIEELEREGFRVLGVITPIDFFWTSDPTMLKVLEKFDEAIRMAKISFKKNATNNLDKLPGVLAKFPEITDCMNSDPNVGHAFKEGAEAYLRGGSIDQLIERSIHCKNAIDVISYLRKFETCKGIMCQQLLTHLQEWVSACFVFEDNEDHRRAVKQCVSPNVSLFVIEGEFTVKGGDTFVANFAPAITNLSPIPAVSLELSVEQRMRDLSFILSMKMKELQKGAPFGGLRYKKEFTQAEELFTKIVSCDNDFGKQWRCFAECLEALPRNFYGAYQLSVFDIQLLKLLAADTVICTGIDAFNNNKAKPVVFDMDQKLDRELFIQRLLGNPAPTKVQGQVNPLQRSMGSSPIERSARTSGTKAAFGFAKKKTSSAETTPNKDVIRGNTRPRSQSEGPMPEARILNPSTEESPKDSTDPDDLTGTLQQSKGI
jgi:hypothetical protein